MEVIGWADHVLQILRFLYAICGWFDFSLQPLRRQKPWLFQSCNLCPSLMVDRGREEGKTKASKIA